MSDDRRAYLKQLCQEVAEAPDGSAFLESIEKLDAFLLELERTIQPANNLPKHTRIPGAS